IKASVEMMLKGYSSQEIVDWWRTREFRYRKNELMRELESEIIGARPLLMAHFHFVDIYQHHFGDKNLGNFDKDKLRKIYLEMDELAGEVKEKAEEQGYDHIIFMSDHGLPTETEHNKNAFYSSNKPLFDEKPKIYDFYDKIKNEIAEV
ncbi:MAG: alkaline phosphatase family protein, partial [Candidatus Nanohaloarchaea archaeon]